MALKCLRALTLLSDLMTIDMKLCSRQDKVCPTIGCDGNPAIRCLRAAGVRKFLFEGFWLGNKAFVLQTCLGALETKHV